MEKYSAVRVPDVVVIESMYVDKTVAPVNGFCGVVKDTQADAPVAVTLRALPVQACAAAAITAFVTGEAQVVSAHCRYDHVTPPPGAHACVI